MLPTRPFALDAQRFVRRSALLASGLLLLVSACSSEEPGEPAVPAAAPASLSAPVARLIDRLHPGVEAGLLPAATRNIDRRLTLREPLAKGWVFIAYYDRIESPGVLRVRLLPSLGRVGPFRARLQRADESPDAARVIDAVTVDAALGVVDIPIPRGYGERPVALSLETTQPNDATPDPVTVPELEIQAGSTLRLAIGQVDEPMRILVEACQGADCDALLEEHVPPGQAWLERTVDLSLLAGGSTGFRFLATSADGARGLRGVFANPTVFAPAPAPPAVTSGDQPRSLLLISLDTLGARHLGLYGSPRDTSPFMDRFFGERGTIFDGLVSTEVHTGPSHMSLFTSLTPTTHGVEAGTFRRLPYTVDTLASRLRAARLSTGAITENAAIYVGGGFERGFDEYRELRRNEGLSGIRETFAAGRDWIERHADERFFLFLHTYETHWRYEPPEPYDALFPDSPTPGDPPDEFSPVDYAREIRFADDQVQGLIDFLDARGLLEQTLVVVTSDHGEAFEEHGQLGHGAQVYGEATHVPLMLAGPGVPAGRRVAGWVSQLDLAPTLLELMGAEPLRDSVGRSLRGAFETGRPAPGPVFSEAWFKSGRQRSESGRPYGVPHRGPTYSVVADGHKLIRNRREEGYAYELYALKGDPEERNDLIESEDGNTPIIREKLVDLIEAYVLESESQRETIRARARAELGAGDREGSIVPDEQRMKMLEALGYLE